MDKSLLRRLFDDTSPGRIVGWVIMLLIIVSSVIVGVETMPSLPPHARPWLAYFEVFVVGIFTLEYVLRVGSAERPVQKALEPLVVIDLIAIVPFYLDLFGADLIDLRILRLLRTLRILRMLKMQRYTSALSMLSTVVRDARHKLLSFLLVASICIVLMGSIMYELEPETFESIPNAIWWSVVTLTTVGYGDTVPETPAGQLVAGLLMLVGIGIVAIPTGIISSGMVDYYHRHRGERACDQCDLTMHDADARHCKACGARLPEDPNTGTSTDS